MAVEACGLIEANLNRAVELIQSFKQTAVDQTSEERRSVELKAYLEDVLTSLHPRLKQTRHRVVVDCPEGLWLDSYPGALFQVLTNLTMNAVTHAYPDGGPKPLTVGLARTGAGVLRLTVEDRGVGMPAGFDWRRSASLGMRLVHALAGQLGAALTAEAGAPGVRFSVEVPLAAAP